MMRKVGNTELSPTWSGWCSFNSSTIHPSPVDQSVLQDRSASTFHCLVLLYRCGLCLKHSIDSITEVMPNYSSHRSRAHGNDSRGVLALMLSSHFEASIAFYSSTWSLSNVGNLVVLMQSGAKCWPAINLGTLDCSFSICNVLFINPLSCKRKRSHHFLLLQH